MRLHTLSHFTSHALDGTASVGYKALPGTYILMVEVGTVPKYKKGALPTLQENLAAWEQAAAKLGDCHERALLEVEAHKAEIANRAQQAGLN